MYFQMSGPIQSNVGEFNQINVAKELRGLPTMNCVFRCSIALLGCAMMLSGCGRRSESVSLIILQTGFALLLVCLDWKSDSFQLSHPPPDVLSLPLRSSSTSRYDSEKRKYQPTPSRITSGSNCRHLNRPATEGARTISAQLIRQLLQSSNTSVRKAS